MNYAVLRIRKLKSRSALRATERHNDAGERFCGKNKALEAAWADRVATAGVSRVRANAVLALEVVLSASPAFFTGADEAARREWELKSLCWLWEEFGDANMIAAWRHEHETTPHLHVVVVPLVERVRKRRGRPPKNGGARPVEVKPTLDAAHLVGRPEALRRLQTGYAQAVEKLGLRRGREGSRRTHISPRAYKAHQRHAAAQAEADRIRAKRMAHDASERATKAAKDAETAARDRAEAARDLARAREAREEAEKALERAHASHEALRILPPALARGWVEVEKSADGEGFEWRMGRGLRIGDPRNETISRTIMRAQELAADTLYAIAAMWRSLLRKSGQLRERSRSEREIDFRP